MSSSRRGPRPGLCVVSLPFAALVAVAALAGCASGQARTPDPQVRASASPRFVAANSGYRIEMEEDGLPAQTPPNMRRAEPDDPSEPYSPNYGRAGSEPAPPRKPLAETLEPPAPLPAPVLPVRPARGMFAASR
jgi:hypothetical protein